MAFNLSRNSRVFVTTNLNTATGAVATSSMSTTNCWEIQVLDGFSFSQSTNAQNITINEAGNTPARGQRSFNTALNPVEMSFSTYIRPYSNAGTAPVTAEERILWNALLGDVGIEGTAQNGSTITATTLGGTPSATLTRADTATATVTFGGTSLNTLTVGGIYNAVGLTGANAAYFNMPFKVVSSSATALVVQYLLAPPTSAGSAPITSVTVAASVKFTQSAWQEMASGAGTYARASSAFSNKNRLQALGFLVQVDNTLYTIDNAAIDSAQIDFGLDGIATVQWSVKGTKLNQLASPMTFTEGGTTAAPTVTLAGGVTGTAVGKQLTAGFITNKLSTMKLVTGLNGAGGGASQASTGLGAGTQYSVVLTGGSISIANNINYVTPANIGVVNTPIGYFTGTRAITGSVTAYLKTASLETAELLKNMLAATAVTEPKFRLQVEIGGASNALRVEAELPAATITLPSVDVQDVISTTINFTGSDSDPDSNATNANFSVENTNGFNLRYYSNV